MTSHAYCSYARLLLIIFFFHVAIVNARSWITLDIPALDKIRSDYDPLYVPYSPLLMEDTALFMYDGTVFGNKESATSKSIYNENETSLENVLLNDAGVNTSIPTNLYSTSPTFATTNEEEDEETIIICPPNQIVHLIQLFDTGGNGWGSTKREIVETCQHQRCMTQKKRIASLYSWVA